MPHPIEEEYPIPYPDRSAEIERLCTEHVRMSKALEWIAMVNEKIDLRKLDTKTLIGLIYELRAKAKAALKPE